MLFRSGKLTGVNIRIGWVQYDENLPHTIGPHGAGSRVGPQLPEPEDLEHSLRWFRGMWMSNRDYLQLLEKAIRTDASGWPSSTILVNGVSNNTGTLWSQTESKNWLGYEPVDDSAAGL